ncbi:MAG: Ig-like domain-containing protein [Salinimicrobium sp.]
MKRPLFRLLFLIFSGLLVTACAKKGTPDGGAIDITPPKYVRARPENFTTNFNAREIRIYFNEYIKLKDPQRQVIISPPMDPRPEITPLGTASKSIRIRINDTLEPRTTYTINFGRSITDNNEGNPLDYFTYAFSTGPYIDSLTVTGNVSDALLKLPDPYISVMLYEVDSTYNDSAVYTRMPRYVTNTLDSATTFQLNNLKEGKYQMVAIRDVNSNYLYDPKTDKIAYADEYVTIPTESVFDLILFKEDLEGKFQRPQQKAQQHLIFGYEGRVVQDSLEINVLSDIPENFEATITKDAKTDTLHYWYKPNMATDTLQFLVHTPGANDTLLTRLKEMKPDSLQFNFEPRGTLNFDQKVKLLPSIPLVEVNDSLVQLVRNDSIPMSFEAEYDRWNKAYIISFDKEEKQSYKFTALPGAFVDFFGKANDTLTAKFNTRSYADYGNVTINLQNVENFPVIVQLTTEQGELKAEKYSRGETAVNFRNISPGQYLLRLIYDTNKNGIWDTGSLLGRRQPEKVVYYPDVLTARANWDDVYTFIVE